MKLSPPEPNVGPWFAAILASVSTRRVNSSRAIPVPAKSTQARYVASSAIELSPGIALMPSSQIRRLPSR